MYSGRLCQVTDIENKIKDKDYIANRFLTCVLMLIGAAGFLIIKRYDSFKTTIFALLAIFKGLEAFSDILYGVMQKNGILNLSVANIDVVDSVRDFLRPNPYGCDFFVSLIPIQAAVNIPFKIFAVRSGSDWVIPTVNRLAV